VLLVEDIDINQELISEMLARLGHRVEFAANGADALNCRMLSRGRAETAELQHRVRVQQQVPDDGRGPGRKRERLGDPGHVRAGRAVRRELAMDPDRPGARHQMILRSARNATTWRRIWGTASPPTRRTTAPWKKARR